MFKRVFLTFAENGQSVPPQMKPTEMYLSVTRFLMLYQKVQNWVLGWIT